MVEFQEAPERQRHHWREGVESKPVVPAGAGTLADSRGTGGARGRRRVLLAIAATVVAAWWATPTFPSRDGITAPLVGNLRLSSDGLTGPLVLVHGSDAGWQIVRAPAWGRPRVIPISHADEELRVISLGAFPIAIQADIAGKHGMQSISASGRVMTVFQAAVGTGVRSGL